MKPVIGITMGDPVGIGPEIIIKSLSRARIHVLCRPFVLGDSRLFEKTIRRLRSPLKIRGISNLEDLRFSGKILNVLSLPIEDLDYLKPGVPNKSAGMAMLAAINKGTEMALKGEIAALVTAPIHKEALRLTGSPHPGHTELLANLSDLGGGKPSVRMMLVGGKLRVILVTTHAALSEVPKLITTPKVFTTIQLADSTMKKHFGIRRPRIAVAGLNPHAGEGGLFGQEDQALIRPAVEQAKAGGIQAVGPLPPDSLFHQAYRGDYDVVVVMYHDQGLIPLKMLSFGHAVNITVGLPFIRTSVDHGTAYDIAGKGIADPSSLIAAIELAVKMVKTQTGGRQSNSIHPDPLKNRQSR
ncbi:MAG TPA: 4-hydroxythreonine-4-phosphate dehydrogenase PdxA [Nitrospiria bacterium]|jgi:4-hydroxythreonine-4-phosphate dehydrogenase|nr:4-hydroxythreonine-4-phosphate dehydrogenase PdxA [Nitrospiria bacterium]